MPIRRKVTYHIKVECGEEEYDNDMDFSTSYVRRAYNQLQSLKEKYSGHKINIVKRIEEITTEIINIPLVESDLEKLAQ